MITFEVEARLSLPRSASSGGQCQVIPASRITDTNGNTELLACARQARIQSARPGRPRFDRMRRTIQRSWSKIDASNDGGMIMRSTVLVALVLLAGCSGSKPAATSFELTTEDATRYVARIWTTTSANQNTIADAVAKATTGGAKGSMTLACRPGTAVVQIVRFASDADALKGSTAPISGIPAAAETRLLRVVSSATGAGAAPVITFSKASSVQFSEFVMRPGKTPDELQEMVKTMHESMTSGGGAPTLASIAQFRANDDKALAMLALWKTKEGMEVFAREKTFGDAPYWDPYATNEHWMCSVAHIG